MAGIEVGFELGRLSVTLAIGERVAIVALLVANFIAIWCYFAIREWRRAR